MTELGEGLDGVSPQVELTQRVASRERGERRDAVDTTERGEPEVIKPLESVCECVCLCVCVCHNID